MTDTVKAIASVMALGVSDSTKLKLISVLISDDASAPKSRNKRRLNRLTDLQVAHLAKVARHADGGGLYLQIDKDGSRYWIFMWKRGGKRRVMGLGSARTVSLFDARREADECRRKRPVSAERRLNLPAFLAKRQANPLQQELQCSI